jgi:hypothetical protein
LTPSVAYVMLVYICLGEYFTQHAPFAFSKDLVEPCKTNWWSTLLHVQVYTNPENLVRVKLTCQDFNDHDWIFHLSAC